MAATDPRILPASCDELSVVTYPSPLRTTHDVRRIPPGATVAEILAASDLGARSGLDVRVWIDGHPVPRDWWDRVRPKAGTSVVAHVVPHGGQRGKGVLMIVLGIVLIVATLGFLAPIGGPALATGIGLAAKLGAGLAAIAGGIQSLAAPPPGVPFDGDIPTSKESPAILGTRNTLRPYAAKRRVLGRHLVFPDYAAKPYTEVVGSDQFLRILFEVGYGPLELSELKIGETPIDELDLEYAVLPGYDDDPELSIFTLGADELPLGITLEDFDDPVARTTELDTHETSIDIVFPAGLIAIGPNGFPNWVQVDLTIEYRTAGSSDPWTGVTPKTPLGPGITNPSAGQFFFRGQVQGQITRGVAWDLPSAGQYEVRLTRGETLYEQPPDVFGESIADTAFWARLRSVRPGVPPRIDNLCLVEMRIRSTDQLSGIVEDFNCISTSVLPIWNGVDEWGPDNKLSTNLSLAATRTPAWCYAEYLRGDVNPLPIPDDRIDALSLAAWAVKTDNDERYIDAVVDFDSTLLEVLRDIAGAARASFSLIDGRYGVVVDEPRNLIAQHFTPRNVHDFSLSKVFKKTPHAMRVTWMSPEAGWQPDVRIVYADGYNEDGSDGKTAASEFVELNLWGITDPDVIYRDARYHLAATLLRPELFSFGVDVEHLPCNRGDLIVLQHDVMKVGLATARIKTVTIDTGKLLSFTVDDVFTYNDPAEHMVRIRKSDGVTLEVQVVNWPDPSAMVVIAESGGVGWTGDAPAVQDLVMFGEKDVETIDAIVHSVTALPDLRARIECLDYAPAIFDSDTEEIPPYDPQITDSTPPQLKRPATPIIESVVSDESIVEVLNDGTWIARILVSVSLPANTEIKPESLQAQYRTADPEGDWLSQPMADASTRQIFIAPVQEGVAYDLRVRSVTRDGRVSYWAAVSDHTVIGFTALPPAPTNLRLEPTDLLTWDYPDQPRDFAGFRIRHQAGTDNTWSTGIPAHDGLLTETRFSVAQIPPGTRSIMLKAVDTGGRESEDPITLIKDITGPPIDNVVATQDEHAGGFTGTKTDCTVNGGTGDLESDSEILLFWEGDDSTAFWHPPDSALFWGDGYRTMTYEWSWAVPGAAAGGQLVIPITIAAGAWWLKYREQGSSEWLTWPGSITAAAVTYEFLLWGSGGADQTIVSALATQIDVADIREFINNAGTPAAPPGGVIIPPTLAFAVITNVYVRAIQVNGAGGMSVQVTKQVGWQQAGATFAVYDAAGVQVVGLIDIEYVGY